MAVITKLAAMRFKEAAHQRLCEGIADTLTYYSFPSSHWRRILANNPLERIMREIRRLSRNVSVFPDGKSALIPAVCQTKAHRRYPVGNESIFENGFTAGAQPSEACMA